LACRYSGLNNGSGSGNLNERKGENTGVVSGKDNFRGVTSNAVPAVVLEQAGTQ